MIDISFEFDTSLLGLSSLDERIRAALADKMIELTQIMYNKVIENVSGKILQKKSGALAAKIAEGVSIDTASNPMVSFVGPADPGPKEYALELGGTRSYAIYPTKAEILHWISKSGESVYRRYVLNHPPSKAFGYLSEAADEMEELVPEGFAEAIDRVLGGSI